MTILPLRSALAACALVTLGLPHPAALAQQPQQPIIIKFSHVVANDTPKGKGAERFKELAVQLTEGGVRVVVYPFSQLY